MTTETRACLLPLQFSQVLTCSLILLGQGEREGLRSNSTHTQMGALVSIRLCEGAYRLG